MVDSVLEVQNIKLPDNGGTTGANVFTSTGNVPTIASGVTFPAGHQIYIKSQNRSGVGSVGSPSSFFPTTTTDLATKSFHLQVTPSEHSQFSKLKIDFNVNFRINQSTHSIIDCRLIRWLGTGDVSSETQLLRGVIGSLTSTDEHYANYSGSYVDDISALGEVQINYTVQYRDEDGGAANAGNIFFGPSVSDLMQISVFGII